MLNRKAFQKFVLLSLTYVICLYILKGGGTKGIWCHYRLSLTNWLLNVLMSRGRVDYVYLII